MNVIRKDKEREEVLVTYGVGQKGHVSGDAEIVIVTNSVRNIESNAFCNYSALRVETKTFECSPTSFFPFLEFD